MEPYLIQLNDNREIEIEHNPEEGSIEIWIQGLEDLHARSITMNKTETKRLIDVLQKKLDLIS